MIRPTLTSHLPADEVNRPTHYAGSVETIDAIESALGRDQFIGYLRGNVLKYASRLGRKGPAITDAEKLQWYANRLVAALRSAS